MTALARLRGELDGDCLTPDDPGYALVGRPIDPAHRDVLPALVIRCRSVRDIALGIEYARDTRTPVVPRSGGHCFAGRSTTTGAVLDLSGLNAITVTGDTARIEAGARLAEVYSALHANGRTIPAGCGATVGIAGLTLGGGIGLLGRVHGLTSDRLTGARVVLADGRTVDCDAEREPDLFWALRGAGGGQFGVVVELAFDTVPEPVATRFVLRWRDPPVADLIAAWQDWAPDVPASMTANLAIGREAVLFGASLVEEESTRELLRAFRDTIDSAPEADVRGDLPFHRVKRSFEDVDAPNPSTAIPRSRSAFFANRLCPATIRALTAALADTPGRRLDFTVMGGAYNRVPAAATAFAHRGERFMLQLVAATDDPWLDRAWATAYADSSHRVYPNFPDPLLPDWESAYHGLNLARLRAVKRAYDPDQCFDFPQSV